MGGGKFLRLWAGGRWGPQELWSVLEKMKVTGDVAASLMPETWDSVRYLLLWQPSSTSSWTWSRCVVCMSAFRQPPLHHSLSLSHV